MSKELNYFSFENGIKNELSGGGKNLDDKNNESITKKYRKKLLELKKVHDNLLIEGVLIPSKKRITACVSSQIGCSLSCTFCATGTLRLSRNLTSGEILIKFLN